jgi:2-polyprenyl-3-methyl-5-hydroxy-6-metoxy-1,4-benzoquinol methylase
VGTPDESLAVATWEWLAGLCIQKLNPKRVLDAGCGMGMFVDALRKRGITAYGVDISEWAVGQRQQDEGFFLCDIGRDSLPFKDRSLDLVVSWYVLEHVSSPDHFIREAHRVLDPSGHLMIAVPAIPPKMPLKLWHRINMVSGRADPSHHSMHPASWWHAMIQAASFIQVHNLASEYSAFRMHHGFERLPPPERMLWRMGKPGRYLLGKVHTALSLKVIYRKAVRVESE